MMIWPSTTLSAELHIHAARLTVWEKFTRLREWPQWQPEVTSATWQVADRWQEGAQFSLQQGRQQRHYLIRMVAVGAVTVWEAATGAAVYSLQLSDQLGGCKVVLRCTVHGFGSVGAFLERGRQSAALRQTLAQLKHIVERK